MRQLSLGGLLGVLLAASSCGQSASASVCSKPQRMELLKVQLQDDFGHFPPSPPFTVKDRYAAWVQVTQAVEGLFGNRTQLYYIANGATPNVTTDPGGNLAFNDPTIIIDEPMTWRKLPMKPGTWQLYSFTNPTIEVVACPAG